MSQGSSINNCVGAAAGMWGSSTPKLPAGWSLPGSPASSSAPPPPHHHPSSLALSPDLCSVSLLLREKSSERLDLSHHFGVPWALPPPLGGRGGLP